MTDRRSFHAFSRIWRWPLLVAVLTLFGLLSALLGQGGIWWILSWIALGVPLVLIAACAFMQRHHGGDTL
jgi:hypothetical protein